MKRSLVVCLILGVLLTLALAAPVAAQGTGITVTCDNGAQFSNGVEVRVVQMRSGFTYRATAIGLNGFDPVLAVLDGPSGTGLCSDDDANAARYTANLPTTGPVNSSNLSAQVTFNHNDPSGFDDISLVVGGFSNQPGEYLLILEGMAITAGDVIGDQFAINITPDMVASGVPLTTYMIAKTNGVDPLIYQTDANANPIDAGNGFSVGCDDAGTQSCWGESLGLSNSYVATQDGNLGGYEYDAMLSLPLGGLALNNNRDLNFYNFLMTTYEGNTLGQYVMAFHIGTAAGDGLQPQTVPATQPPQQQFQQGSAPGGVTVTCDNGAQFTNGIEVRVIQMRAGFTYTATAVGLNGFDPVLAVLDGPNGTGLCSDDDANAARFSASLPSTGLVGTSNLSAQVTFNHNDPSGFDDISLVVGGFGDQTGEFILILDGMAVTAEDNAGDPFSINITPGMVASGVPLTTYMIAKTNGLDPLIYQIDENFNPLPSGPNTFIGCDDAGTDSCYGFSTELSNSYVSTSNGQLGGYQFDAMLETDLSGMSLNSNYELNFLNFLMTSYQQNTLGQYVMVFHMGTSTSFAPSA